MMPTSLIMAFLHLHYHHRRHHWQQLRCDSHICWYRGHTSARAESTGSRPCTLCVWPYCSLGRWRRSRCVCWIPGYPPDTDRPLWYVDDGDALFCSRWPTHLNRSDSWRSHHSRTVWGQYTSNHDEFCSSHQGKTGRRWQPCLGLWCYRRSIYRGWR